VAEHLTQHAIRTFKDPGKNIAVGVRLALEELSRHLLSQPANLLMAGISAIAGGIFHGEPVW
jgi:hypothetical protein